MSQQARASSSPPFPQEAYSYAAHYHLGQPVAVYRVGLRQNLILGIISLLLAGLFTMVVISGQAAGVSILLLLLLAVLCVMGGVYYLIYAPLRHRSWRIYACTDGLVFLKGDQAVSCRWDQVAFVWQRVVRYYTNGVYSGASFKYTVQRADGVQIIISSLFPQASQLGDHIQREVTNRLTPQALAAVQAGQTLPFGRFHLSRAGLATPQELLPWSEVQQVSVNRGLLEIQRRGQTKGQFYGGVDTIPNLYVFLNVSKALIQER